MKPVTVFLWAACGLSLSARAERSTNSPVSTPQTSAVVQRGSYWRVWQTVSGDTNELGNPILLTNTFTELRNGLNYLQDGQWVDSVPAFAPSPNGAIALQGQHLVSLNSNLNAAGAIDVFTPDGQRLRSTPLVLAYYDTGSGQSVLLGTVQNSVGQLVSSNQVLFANAFTNLSADVVLTYWPEGLEQMIVLRQNPPAPAAFGLDPLTTRLELWTEYQQAAVRSLRTRLLKATPTPASGLAPVEAWLVDQILGFGSMLVEEARVYPVGAEGAETSGQFLAKQWLVLGGRNVLIMAVEYPTIQSVLATLPAAVSTNRPTTAVQGRVLPATPTPSAGFGPMPAAASISTAPGVVFKSLLANTDANVRLKGDTTYLVSGELNLQGTTTLEAGVVLKYREGGASRINLWGPLANEATAYRPAIFTAKDDDSVGVMIGGSTGQPAGYYGNPALAFGDAGGGGVELAHVRISYARLGLRWGPGVGYGLSHGQVVHCETALGLAYSEGYLRNVLVYDVGSTVAGGPLGTVRGEHLTIHQAGAVNPNPNLTLYLTNSLLAAVTVTNNFVGQSIGIPIRPSRAFLQVRGGAHYLPPSSPYRQVGTTNINPKLATELKSLTTVSPPELGGPITTALVLSPQVPRDTGVPDLGYHYDAVDYICSNLGLANATLVLTNGVVLGVVGASAFNLLSGAKMISEGLPARLNRLVRYQAVQELALGANPPNQGFWQVAAAYSVAPEIRLRFTDLPMLADRPAQRQYLLTADGVGTVSALTFMDCRLRGGVLSFAPANSTPLMTVALTNNVAERVSLNYRPSGATSLAVFIRNNLFLRSQISLSNPNTNSSGPWEVFDNLFDSVDLAAAGGGVANGYNGYLNTPVLPGGSFNVIMSSFAYVAGPLGNFYQGAASLRDQGSRTADQTGLYHYTTSTNQVKEGNSRVDIGFHYLATRAQFRATNDFAGAQGFNQWYYRYSRTPGGWPDLFLTHYDAATATWSASGDTNCWVAASSQSPSAHYDSIRTFIAPYAGDLRLEGIAFLAQPLAGPGGAQVRVLKNHDTLVDWTPIGPSGVPIQATTTVQPGDAIHFQVSQTGSQPSVPTLWQPVVTYADSELQKSPWDADGDGLPDYVEDRNGNGLWDTGETDWRRVDTDRDGVSDFRELVDGTNPLDPTSFDPASPGYWNFGAVDFGVANLPVSSVFTVSSPSIISRAIVERGPYWRVWQTVMGTTDELGNTVQQTNTYTELRSGLNYLQNGQWVDSAPAFIPNTNGAIAQQGQYQVSLNSNLNTAGAIDVVTPDGQRLRSTPLALAYYDAGSGQSVLLATVQNSVGQLVSSNQVLYANAFTNLPADVVLTCRPEGLDQTVVLHQSPPTPATYGLDPQTTRLELWTEFQQAPVPNLRSRTLKPTATPASGSAPVEPWLVDQILGFGSMLAGEGRVYALGVEGAETYGQFLAKQWLPIGGRNALITAVEYPAIQPALATLPASAVTNRVATAIQGRALPPAPPPGTSLALIQAAASVSGAPAVVFKSRLANTDTSVRLRGDATYLVSGEFNLQGTNTLEAGVVVKYREDSGSRINLWGPLANEATAYRPAIFTAKDDDSVGVLIGGSTGQPVGYYGSPALYFGDAGSGGVELSHVRIGYARVGLRWGPGVGYGLSHGQVVHCETAVGLAYSEGYLRNVLVHDAAGGVVSGPLGTVRGEHLTIHQAGAVNPNPGLTVYLTNSLLADVALTNNFAGQSSAILTGQTPAFQTAGAGAHYLAPVSPYRHAGTRNINAKLAFELTKLTTYPPVELRRNFLGSSPLAPRAPRDTGPPDLGYHYDPLDFICGNLKLTGATLVLTNGVCLGIFGPHGFSLQSGAKFYSEGTPAQLNCLVRYFAVQEQNTRLSYSTPAQAVWQTPASASPPEIHLRFTDLPVLAGSPQQRQYVSSADGPPSLSLLAAMDCQLRGGLAAIQGGGNTSLVALTNNVVERAQLSFNQPTNAGFLAVYLRNNLFLRSQVSLNNPAGVKSWEAFDNLFDTVDLAVAGAGLAHGYNGYLNTLALPGGTSNVVMTNFAYAAGPLGNFYQASGDLRDRGSRTAGLAGLYEYTTTTNEVKEGNSLVDIGLHYVATRFQFQASSDFSSQQGSNHWFYRYASQPRGWPDTTLPSFDPVSRQWGGSADTNCFVGADFQSSGSLFDSVRTFVAPSTGTLTISALVTNKPNAVSVGGGFLRVLKNRQPLLDWTPLPTGTNALPISLTSAVTAGDAIHFQLTAAANSAAVYWNPLLTYLDPGLQQIPWDSAGNGQSDYLSDRNGNGVFAPPAIYYLDSDGDGRSDSAELAEGTDPFDPTNFEPARMGYWRFNRPDWRGEDGQQPIQAFNVSSVPSFDGNALQVRLPAGHAVLQYRGVEANGLANVFNQSGSVRFLYQPTWSSVSFGGQGPGQPARLWELGDPDQPGGGLALWIDAPGDHLFFTSQDAQGNRYEVSGTAAFSANNWYEFSLALSSVPISATNRVRVWIYDNLVIDQEGISYLPLPPDAVRAREFTLGSSADGSRQALGLFDELETFNYELGDTGSRMNNNVFSATATPPDARIDLQWRRGANTQATLQRKADNELDWTTLTTTSAWSYSDTDTRLQPGQSYQYRLLLGGTKFVENTLRASLNLPPIENRGAVILLVDQTLASSLSNSLDQLRLDLVGDGWTVLRHEVPRHDDHAWDLAATNAAYVADLSLVKAFITNDYYTSSVPVKAVLILGHVTIPYSGVGAEDGHTADPFDAANHYGAWPADAFYGDIDGHWTDQSVNYPNTFNPVLQNLPGDGKFDQYNFPGPLKLAVGRVDFAQLPAFGGGPQPRLAVGGPKQGSGVDRVVSQLVVAGSSELDLLRQYLDKDHRYRQGLVILPQRAIVQGNVASENAAFYRQALVTSSSLFGFDPGKLLAGDLFTEGKPCLWGFEVGPGARNAINTGAANQHSSTDMADATREPPIAFYMLDGSYFPDWNLGPDNFMRATLATRNYGLIALWGRLGMWNLGSLALGGTFGDAFLETANDPAQVRSVRTTFLLGDPTLRKDILAPATNLLATANTNGTITLAWDPAADSQINYFVYRSSRLQINSSADFARLTATPILGNTYLDNSPPGGVKTYQVRAVKLTSTGSGAYTNLSEGVFVTMSFPLLVSQSPDQVVAEQSTLRITNVASELGVPAGALHFSLGPAPAGVQLDANTGVLTWTPAYGQGPSTNRISVIVTDNGLPPFSATNTFAVVVNKVNRPPVLVVPPNATLSALTTLVVTNIATDPDLPPELLTFSLVAGPTGMRLDSNTGVLTWTPTKAQEPSTNTIIVLVTDNGVPPLSAAGGFTVVVRPVSTPPVLTVPTNQVMDELTTLVVTNTASAADLPVSALVFGLVAAPTGVHLDPNTGVLTWTPTEAQGPSTNTITVKVSDNRVPPLSSTNGFIVVVNEVNLPPVLTVPPSSTVNALATLVVTNTAFDPDIPPNNLTFGLVAGPVGVQLDSHTGVLTWTPTRAQGPSTNTISVKVTDDGIPPLSVTNSFTVVVIRLNNPPVLTVPANQTIDELTTLVVTNMAVDPDVPPSALLFSLVTAPVGVSLDPHTGVLTWTPTEAQGPSTNLIAVKLSDNGAPPLSATNSFTVVVNEVNLPPVLTVPANQTVEPLVTLVLTNTATDPDLPPNLLAFSLVAAPSGAILDTNTGIFTWTPRDAQRGTTNTITVRVTDNGVPPLSDTKSFTITVTTPNRPPVIKQPVDRTINPSTTLLMFITATDPDLPAETLSFGLLAAPPGVRLDANSGLLIWTPTPAQAGSTNTIVVQVTDNGVPPSSATASFTIVVTPPNQPPTLTVPANQVIKALTTLVLTNHATDPDLPAETLTFSLLAAPAGMRLDSASGVLTWTPTAAQAPSTNAVTVQVTDSGAPPLSDTKSFTVVVNPASTVHILSLSQTAPGEFELKWSAEVGQQYEVLYKSQHQDTAWTSLATITASNSVASVKDRAGPQAQRIYQVRRSLPLPVKPMNSPSPPWPSRPTNVR